MAHLIYSSSSNEHLQNALALYGLSAFMVKLVEEYIIDPAISDAENAANLLALEQLWLNWLFNLHQSFRYNFSSVAGAPMAGRIHTEDTKALMSAAKTGSRHTEE